MAKKSIVNFMIVQDFLRKIGGEETISLVKLCENKRKSTTDEEIGKKIPLKITEIRTILNKLHFQGIACYQKTRNNKTGWYSYTWEIKPDRIAELILEQQEEEILKLEQKISFEQNYDFFGCKKGCDYFPFEIAAEYQFKCPECGKTMETIDNSKRTKNLKRKITILKKEICELQKIK
jgi:transcription initiation factor TFIIE subunit alpha